MAAAQTATMTAFGASGRHVIDQLVLFSEALTESESFLETFFPSLVPGQAGEAFASVRYIACDGPAAGRAATLSSFWKFTVFTDDVDALRNSIHAEGLPVSEPIQFGDIGYLCHLTEPGGNGIELLQRTFAQSPRSDTARADGLGLITLRVSDRRTSLDFFQDVLTMSELCEMAVDDGRPDPFDLYFLASTEARPPSSDPTDVVNREWLYLRPYSIIELQCYRQPAVSLHQDQGDSAGLAAVIVRGLSANIVSPDGHPFVPGDKAPPN